jgi:DNA-binding protein
MISGSVKPFKQVTVTAGGRAPNHTMQVFDHVRPRVDRNVHARHYALSSSVVES